jgi:hypothetical protein
VIVALWQPLTTTYGRAMGAVLGAAPLLILLLVTAPVLVAIAARPQRGILLIAAIIPYNGLLLILHTPRFSEGYKEALIIWTTLWALMNTSRRQRMRPLPKYAAPLFFWFAVGVASALTVNRTQGPVGLKLMVFYPLILVPLWRCPLNARDRDRFVTVLLANGLITAIVGLWDQAVGGWHLVSLGYEWDENILTTHGWLRSISTFNQPFPFAFFLMLVLVVGAAVSLEEPRRPRSALFFVSTPVMVAALAVTFVRAAWLGLAIGFLYLAFRRYNVMLLALPFALFGLLILPAGFSSAQFESGSLNQRQDGWAQNLSRAADPFGNGIGSTGAAGQLTRKRLGRNLAELTYQPDNYYYKVLYELGVTGLWFFILVLVAGFLVTLPMARRPGLDGALGYAMGAHVLGAMSAAFFATYLEIFPANLYFWMILGIAAGVAAHEPLPAAEVAPMHGRAGTRVPVRALRPARHSRAHAASGSGNGTREPGRTGSGRVGFAPPRGW